mmetsp:Transcript_72845/g.194438  ORF Transcript_72845/g.194438 Transcript_72845/m.194438 type:complete len:335 (+) Transcript_72845:186-1190(+)
MGQPGCTELSSRSRRRPTPASPLSWRGDEQPELGWCDPLDNSSKVPSRRKAFPLAPGHCGCATSLGSVPCSSAACSSSAFLATMLDKYTLHSGQNPDFLNHSSPHGTCTTWSHGVTKTSMPRSKNSWQIGQKKMSDFFFLSARTASTYCSIFATIHSPKTRSGLSNSICRLILWFHTSRLEDSLAANSMDSNKPRATIKLNTLSSPAACPNAWLKSQSALQVKCSAPDTPRKTKANPPYHAAVGSHTAVGSFALSREYTSAANRLGWGLVRTPIAWWAAASRPVPTAFTSCFLMRAAEVRRVRPRVGLPGDPVWKPAAVDVETAPAVPSRRGRS